MTLYTAKTGKPLAGRWRRKGIALPLFGGRFSSAGSALSTQNTLQLQEDAADRLPQFGGELGHKVFRQIPDSIPEGKADLTEAPGHAHLVIPNLGSGPALGTGNERIALSRAPRRHHFHKLLDDARAAFGASHFIKSGPQAGENALAFRNHLDRNAAERPPSLPASFPRKTGGIRHPARPIRTPRACPSASAADDPQAL